jgi:uncharacterized repeat protein (TIGR03803 family)
MNRTTLLALIIAANSRSVPGRRAVRLSTRRVARSFALAALGVLLALMASPAEAQTLTTLGSFNNADGNGPSGNLTLVGSTLYGTTVYGGANGLGNGDGTVFSIPVTGGVPSTVVSLNGTNGANPYSGLTLSGSTLYGPAYDDGANGWGTVFSVPVAGGSATVLHAFSNINTDGTVPYGGLAVGGTTLYGTTYGGGANGWGTVFSMPLTGGNPTILFSFNATSGENPFSNLTISGSTLFGTTSGGGAFGDGTVFSIPVTGGTPKILFSFNGTNGQNPYGTLTLIGSTLYGTTQLGGSGSGTIFSVPVIGGTPTVLLSFNGNTGANPYGGLTLVGSTLYGTTRSGGANGDGTIFSIPLGGGPATTLLAFSGVNGIESRSGLTLGGSTLYGTTFVGGANNDGTVFALAVNELINGRATADKTNAVNQFGTPLIQIVGQGASYGGLLSTVTATTGSGGGPMLGTTATILAGTNSGSFTGGATTVSMAWRTRTLDETPRSQSGTPASPPLPHAFSPLISDVLNLSGMSNSANEPAPSDPFVLQMSYDQALLKNEAAQAAGGAIYLAWLNPTGGPSGVPLWQNAILGDTGNNATLAEQGFLGSFATFQTDINDTKLSDYIGAWGVDTANHDVWAVIDHNSDFAVVPEPSALSLAILAVAAAGIFGYGRMRRRGERGVSAGSR